jgi:hypothetical protein
MDETKLVSVISLCLGIALSIAVVVAALLRQTRGVPIARRPRLMVLLACSAIVHVLYRRNVAAVVVGFLAFVGSLCVGLAATFCVIWATSPEYSHPTEAYETFGDYVIAMEKLACGATVAFSIAGIVGFAVGVRIASGGSTASKEQAPTAATSDSEIW